MADPRELSDRPSRGVHTCHDGCPCHTGGHPAPDFEEAAPCEFANGRCVTCGTVGYDPGDLEQITRDIAVLSRAALTPAQEVNRMGVSERWWRIEFHDHSEWTNDEQNALDAREHYDYPVTGPFVLDTPPTQGAVGETDELRARLAREEAEADGAVADLRELIAQQAKEIERLRREVVPAQGVVSGRVIERVECSGCGQEWHAMDCGGCGREVTVRYVRASDEEDANG